jgi:hypothetical protein
MLIFAGNYLESSQTSSTDILVLDIALALMEMASFCGGVRRKR